MRNRWCAKPKKPVIEAMSIINRDSVRPWASYLLSIALGRETIRPAKVCCEFKLVKRIIYYPCAEVESAPTQSRCQGTQNVFVILVLRSFTERPISDLCINERCKGVVKNVVSAIYHSGYCCQTGVGTGFSRKCKMRAESVSHTQIEVCGSSSSNSCYYSLFSDEAITIRGMDGV